jgi:hypothetical protein
MCANNNHTTALQQPVCCVYANRASRKCFEERSFQSVTSQPLEVRPSLNKQDFDRHERLDTAVKSKALNATVANISVKHLAATLLPASGTRACSWNEPT